MGFKYNKMENSQLVLLLLLEIIPILLGISEIRSLIKDETPSMSKTHVQHHISLIGLLICFLLYRVTLTIEYNHIIHDVIINSIITFLFSVYAIVHLRAERKGEEDNFITPKGVLKIILKKLKELIIWKV